MTYFSVFLFSICFSYLADKTYKNKCLFLLYSILSIVPLILMAGYRDETIGVDTMAYPQQTLDYVQSYASFSQIVILGFIVEPLYIVLAQMSVLLFGDNLTSLLLLQHIIIVLLFYISFVKLRKNMPIWMGMFMFCFLFYNMSLNIQRQMIAVSFMFLGTTYLLHNKRKKSLMLFITAFFFHKTSIIAVVVLLSLYYQNYKWCKYSVVFCGLFLLGYTTFMTIITSMSFFSKYIVYQQGEEYPSSFSITELLTRILFLSLLFKFGCQAKYVVIYKCIICLFICEFLLNITQVYSAYFGRIGLGLFTLYSIYLPLWVFCFRNSSIGKIKIRKRVTSCVAFFIMISWWYVYIKSNAGETYPYSSGIITKFLCNL